MKERKIIRYFPRSHFWKIWEKRKVEAILIETDEKVKSKNFRIDGTLRRSYIRWQNGDQIEKFYFPNGQLFKEMNVHGSLIRHICWDTNGCMIQDALLDEKTETEMRYYPNGQLKIRYQHKTGEYEEWAENGALKKKGYLFSSCGEPAFSIGGHGIRFETGNMRIKQKDEQRQEYNEAIDAVDNLPATPGRKIAKKALAEEYKKNQCKIRD